MCRVLVIAPHPDDEVLGCGGAASDHWRITPVGLAHLLAESWSGSTTTAGCGNLRTCLGTLIGEAAAELTAAELDDLDPRYPLIACAAAHRDT